MLTKRRWAPSFSSNWPAKPGWRRSMFEISSRSVEPSAATTRSPPTVGRNMLGTRTLAIYRSTERRHGRTAERLVIDELVDGRVVAAQRAVGIARNFDLAEFHAQAVEEQQAVHQRLAQAKQQLDG